MINVQLLCNGYYMNKVAADWRIEQKSELYIIMLLKLDKVLLIIRCLLVKW